MLFFELILAALGIQGSYRLQQPLPLSVAGTWGEKKRAEYTERRLCWQLLLLEFHSFVFSRAINLGGVGGKNFNYLLHLRHLTSWSLSQAKFALQNCSSIDSITCPFRKRNKIIPGHEATYLSKTYSMTSTKLQHMTIFHLYIVRN